MTGKPRSLRQAQSMLAGQLRAKGRTWAEVAAEFRAVYRVNARVALRQAHGWSQPQAAARWNARWPADPKTFKNFSYWELWPGATGQPAGGPGREPAPGLARGPAPGQPLRSEKIIPGLSIPAWLVRVGSKRAGPVPAINQTGARK
jgi:hypothetical protein